jgi:hypothetical protein
MLLAVALHTLSVVILKNTSFRFMIRCQINKSLFACSVEFRLGANVGSYTQVRIAGDFLSSRKAARAEKCTPKTTAAALDG